jgi:hypothetical protein
MIRTATSEGLVGEVLQMRGEKDEAVRHYRNAADLRAKIAEREPQDAKAQKELANIRAKIDKLMSDTRSSEVHLCSL